MNHAAALNETLEYFGLSAREVASRSGVREAALSQFRHGKKDLNLESWEKLIEALPVDAKQYMYLKLLVGDLDNRGLSQLLSAISFRLLQDSEAKEVQESERTLVFM
jgi:transcriptional regulator with XRE-family HTH domain